MNSCVRPVAAERVVRAGTRQKPLRLCLLRSFELRAGADLVALPTSAQRLMALLALRDQGLLRGRVAATLWMDKTEQRASANLRSALWRLRRPGLELVESNGAHLKLASSIAVDLWEVRGQARRLLEDDDDRCESTDLNIAPLCADLLPDWYDEWVLLERERFRQLRLHALEALCRRFTRAGRFAAAIEAGLAAVAGEPLRESAHRVLIETYLEEGNATEAIRQYRSYRSLLNQALGLEPSPRMKALVRHLPFA